MQTGLVTPNRKHRATALDGCRRRFLDLDPDRFVRIALPRGATSITRVATAGSTSDKDPTLWLRYVHKYEERSVDLGSLASV
jgi:hypothetical protein